MATFASFCPTEEWLLAFSRGELPRASVQRLDSHLDNCRACRVTIAALTPNVARQMTPSVPTGDVPAIKRVAEPRLSPGMRVDGRYRVVSLRGRGGMSEVYEVEDELLTERIALKILSASFAPDERANRRLKRELLLARRITHPSVCRLFDLGQEGDLLFLTMELLPGQTLATQLRARGRLPGSEARLVALQVCSALDAAHRIGVIHRDLKSDNVVLVRRSDEGASVERAVITDFGLARSDERSAAASANRTTLRGAVIGTLSHAAPEQLLGHAVTTAADVYALGVVLYEMVTGGKLPFPATTVVDAIHLRLRASAPSPRRWMPDVDTRWEQAILRCLEPEPSARFPSVQAVADALAL